MEETIRHQEEVFEQLIENGANLLESAEPGSEKDALDTKLEDTKQRWHDIKQKVADHLNRVNKALPEAEKYDDCSRSLGPWLSETEEKLDSLKPIVANQDALDHLNETVAALRGSVDQHKPERDTVSLTSASVTDLAEVDVDVIKNEAKDTLDRYDKLDAALLSREKELTEVGRLLSHYQVLMKPVDALLKKVDAAIESQGPISADLEKNREDLNAIKVRSCVGCCCFQV